MLGPQPPFHPQAAFYSPLSKKLFNPYLLFAYCHKKCNLIWPQKEENNALFIDLRGKKGKSCVSSNVMGLNQPVDVLNRTALLFTLENSFWANSASSHSILTQFSFKVPWGTRYLNGYKYISTQATNGGQNHVEEISINRWPFQKSGHMILLHYFPQVFLTLALAWGKSMINVEMP